MSTDPVCGMEVYEGAAPVTQFAGVTFYFCSARCLGRFLDHPAAYADDYLPLRSAA